MRSGKRNQLVEIQSVTSTQDASGDPTRGYATLFSPWANIVSASGGETLDGKRMQVAGECSHVVTIPWRNGVTRQMRVLWGSRALEILAVRDFENRHVDLILECKEQT